MIRSSAAVLAALLASTSLTSVAMAQTPTASSSPATGFATSDATDPYLWLEEVEGERAMEWVKAHNARTFAVLQGDPRYDTLHQQALTSSRRATAFPASASTATAP